MISKKEMKNEFKNKKENAFLYLILIVSLFLILLFSLIVNIGFSSSFVSSVSAEELKVTQEHPFLINGQWIEAKDLKVGDYLTTIDGRKARITKLTDVKLEDNEAINVYNLEALPFNDFVVNGIVVHNSDSAIRLLISKVDLNNLDSDSSVRISEVEITLQRKLSDIEKKTLIGAHKYGGSLSIDCNINYRKGMALREVFSEEDTRILMERGYAGRLVVRGKNGYWELNRNLAVANKGLERWVVEHTETSPTAIIDPCGNPWTRKQGEDFIRSVIQKIDKDYSPHRNVYESPSFFELNPRDGTVWEKKVVWEVESTGNRDPSYTSYIGGDNFHSRRFVRIRRVR